MSSPLYARTSGAIAQRWLTGSPVILFVGDSIGVSLEAGFAANWTNPVKGFCSRGSDLAFFSSDSKVTLSDGGPNQTSTAGLTFSAAMYSPMSTREAKFTGVAYGAVASALSNRIMDNATQTLMAATATRSAGCQDGLDWIAQCTNMTCKFVTYSTAGDAQPTLIRPYMLKDATLGMLADGGTPDTSAGYVTTSVGFTSASLGTSATRFDVRVDQGTPNANKGFAMVSAAVIGDRATGHMIVPVSVGGFGTSSWVPGYSGQKGDLSTIAALSGFGITDVVIELTTNGPLDVGGGFADAATYKIQLQAMVTAIRAVLPSASITFLCVHDTDSTNTGFLSQKVDKTYEVQQATSNSQFINLYRAGGDWDDIHTPYLSDGIHLNSDGVVWEIGLLLSTVTSASYDGTITGGSGQTVRPGDTVHGTYSGFTPTSLMLEDEVLSGVTFSAGTWTWVVASDITQVGGTLDLFSDATQEISIGTITVAAAGNFFTFSTPLAAYLE